MSLWKSDSKIWSGKQVSATQPGPIACIPCANTLPIMKFLAVTLAAAAFVAGAPAATETLLVNTPGSAIQCENTLLTWLGGVSPFELVYVVL
ncbi:hypothetical protein EIP91_004212 [Steccherinum ochraceum]|uniref:Uncharacterized protein n=1 Tax=Steccherinum ochraceum TaxID=92696 RepID=A0A4R0RCB2_9APHY|nr:hypothetical protein EIP91_004212 [Steccherinum ochraceum]